jgi:hypothetical protein
VTLNALTVDAVRRLLARGIPFREIARQLRELALLLAPKISRTGLAGILAALVKALGPIGAPIVLQFLIDLLPELNRHNHEP